MIMDYAFGFGEEPKALKNEALQKKIVKMLKNIWKMSGELRDMELDVTGAPNQTKAEAAMQKLFKKYNDIIRELYKIAAMDPKNTKKRKIKENKIYLKIGEP